MSVERDIELVDFIDEFANKLQYQLEQDQLRWGNTWRHRPREGQEARIESDIRNYFDQFTHANVPVPWLKIAGLALIAYVREEHPDTLDVRGGYA